ncbi:VOC family protein [Halobellus rarus]|uniref:VOC family protein n=1 Tax=Halobellus rarus TaxID=1126237 RepID=A0ABD6CR33_9EURY|nr:VOC family protein [Halobellus rarus]
MESPTAHHIGIAVEDLETMVTFYRETLDFEVTQEFTLTGEAFSKGLGVEDTKGEFARLSMGGVLLELVEYTPAHEPTPVSGVADPGSVHIAVSYDDVSAFYEGLSNVDTVSEPVTTPSGTTIVFLRDPENNLVEIVSN